MLTTATVWVAGWLGDAQDAHLRTVFGALVGLWDLCWPVLADHKTVAGGWDAHTDRLGHWSTSAGGALALAHLGYSADPSNVVLLDPLDLASELAASLPVHYQVRGCTRSVSEQAARSRRAGTGDRSWLQAMAAHELTARIQRAVPASVRDGEADWARLFAAAWRRGRTPALLDEGGGRSHAPPPSLPASAVMVVWSTWIRTLHDLMAIDQLLAVWPS